MKKKYLAILGLFLVFNPLQAQVGIGTTSPDASSVLDITAIDKGVLVPRVNLVDVSNTTTPVATPATGLLVWNTNASTTGGNGVGFYFFNGVQWMSITGTGVEKIDDLLDGKSDSDGTDDGSSVFLGLDAGANDDESNNGNVGVGYQTLFNNSTGAYNTAIGNRAMYSNSSGLRNVAYGGFSMHFNTTGENNTALGYQTLFFNTTGSFNTAIGSLALGNNISGSFNTAIGASALISNTTGSNNLAIGVDALQANTIGEYNIANGYNALYSNTTGINNIAQGYRSLYSNTTGEYNIGIGRLALYSNTFGDHNIAQGYQALYNNISANNNIALGYRSLYSNTTGTNNIANGYQALNSNSTGNDNIAKGYQALYTNTSGDNNIAQGYRALFSNTTGYDNIANGYQALYSNTSGNYNIAQGYQSLHSNITGSYNIAIGNNTLLSNIHGQENIAIGVAALRSSTNNASYNIGIGTSALSLNENGYANIAIGYRSLMQNLGGSNIAIGYRAGEYETGSNKLYIENSQLDANNALIYGEFDNDLLRFNATLQMGQAGTSSYLEIANLGSDNLGLDGDIVPYGGSTTLYDLGNNNATEHWDEVVANTFTTFSDRRTKNSIKQLDYGLQEILQLNPVSFRYNKGIADPLKTRLGLIAQEVETVIPEIVISEDVDINPDSGQRIVTPSEYKSMSYQELIPVLIKAIQEQQTQIEELKKKIK